MSDKLVQSAENLYSESEFENKMQERRSEGRILAFCQVLDLFGDFVGVTFDLTTTGICMSLPNTWSKKESFSIILKRGDLESLPEIKITVNPLWRKSRNELYDEIGGKIVAIESATDFQEFLSYCQKIGPSGLFSEY